MGSIKKYAAEFLGTMVLVIVGCGTAMTVGCDAANGGGYILTALAFGLAIVALAYSVGNVSGCHINPAVSVAFWINGELETKDLCGYIVSQILGAFAGAGILKGIFALGKLTDKTGGLGSNGIASLNGSVIAGILVECILTFIFIFAILGVTSKKAAHGHVAGRSYAGACTHPRHRPHRHFGEPGEKLRTGACGCICRQHHTDFGCVDLLCRTFGRCGFGSCCIPSACG